MFVCWRMFWKLQKHLLETVFAGPRELLSSPCLSWDVLLKKDRSEAGTADKCGHASISSKRKHAAGYQWWASDTHTPTTRMCTEQTKQLLYNTNNNILMRTTFTVVPWVNHCPKKNLHGRRWCPRKKKRAKRGWILEVHLEYSVELHKAHNGYPLAPEKKKSRKNGCWIIKKCWRKSWG